MVTVTDPGALNWYGFFGAPWATMAAEDWSALWRKRYFADNERRTKR